jgi:L-aminopeptidase/D-esterase-like protein
MLAASHCSAWAQPYQFDSAQVIEKKPRLVPVTTSSGAELTFDFPSLKIGVAEYEEGPTGATVFYFAKGAFAAVDVRGGAPGTLMTDGIRNGYDSGDAPWIDAICFAGGSCYGLEAASGVMAELLDQRGGSNAWSDIAVVPGAIVFDFNNRSNAIYPDKGLGRAALRSAKTGRFPLGARGAGRYVHCGGYLSASFRERSGQGGAFRQIGHTKIAVFTVVNSLGAIIDRRGSVVRGNRDPTTGRRSPIRAAQGVATKSNESPPTAHDGRPTENTTLTLIVTNRRLPYVGLQRLAVETHGSLNRAIQPFNTSRDGDTLFAATTAEVEDREVDFATLAMVTAELAWDAVLSAVSAVEATMEN